MILSQNTKINIYSCKPAFPFIKLDLPGIYLDGPINVMFTFIIQM